jgi:integrase/recombinase XerD
MHSSDDTLLAQFEGSLVRAGLAATTVINYLADLRCFVRWLEDQTPPNGGLLGVQTEDLQRYQGCMGMEGRSPNTINRRIHALRKFYEFAVAGGWMAASPARDVQPVSLPELATPRALSDEEVQALMDAVPSIARSSLVKRDYAIILLLLGTGLKVSELVALQLEDVEFLGEAGYLLVGEHRKDGGRYIPLSSTVCDALKEYLQVRPRVLGVHHLFLSQGGRSHSQSAEPHTDLCEWGASGGGDCASAA